LLHGGRVLGHGPHDVDGQQAPALADLARRPDLAVNGFQVGSVDGLFGPVILRQASGASHEVGVVSAQVHR